MGIPVITLGISSFYLSPFSREGSAMLLICYLPLPTATRTSFSPGSQVIQEKSVPESRQEPWDKDWPDRGCVPSVTQDHGVWCLQAQESEPFCKSKNRKARTCYLPPHPRTHEEPHEEGEQQRDPKGDEGDRPHGEDQAHRCGQRGHGCHWTHLQG